MVLPLTVALADALANDTQLTGCLDDCIMTDVRPGTSMDQSSKETAQKQQTNASASPDHLQRSSGGALSPFSPLLRGKKSSTLRWSDEDLSLSSTRKVSVVVRVQETDSTHLSLFPYTPNDFGTSVLHHHTSREMVLVNPKALGKVIPSEITLETAKLVAQMAHIRSEDWARLYAFQQVQWPGSNHELEQLGHALVNDITATGSISCRVLLSLGNSEKTQTVFGRVAQQSIAKVFADASKDLPTRDVIEKYGFLGLVTRDVLERLRGKPSWLTLSVLELADDDVLHDMLASRPFPSDPSKKLRVRHQALSGAVVEGLSDVPIDSLKALGHSLRRAFAAAHHKRRPQPRGHLIATLKVYSGEDRCTVAQFVDVAHADGVNARRDAFCRKSLSTLGAVLRGTLLKEAGNDTTQSFRESTLTKILQRSIDHPDSRLVVLADVSPLSNRYDETLGTLRYVSRLLYSGPPIQSPSFSKLSSSKSTTPTSHSSTTSSPMSLQQFTDQETLLQNVVSDPRQRLARVLKRKTKGEEAKVEPDENHVPANYMDNPAEALNRRLSIDIATSPMERSSIKTPIVANGQSRMRESMLDQLPEQDPDVSLTLDHMAEHVYGNFPRHPTASTEVMLNAEPSGKWPHRITWEESEDDILESMASEGTSEFDSILSTSQDTTPIPVRQKDRVKKVSERVGEFEKKTAGNMPPMARVNRSHDGHSSLSHPGSPPASPTSRRHLVNPGYPTEQQVQREINIVEKALNRVKSVDHILWESSLASIFQLRAHQRSMKDAMERLTSERDDAHREIKSCVSAMDELRKSQATSHDIEEKMRMERDTYRATLEMSQNDLKSQFDEFEAERKKNEERIAEIEEELERMTSERAEVVKICEEAIATQADLEEKNAELGQHADFLQEELEQLRAQTGEDGDLTKEIRRLKVELAQAKDELLDRETKIAEFKVNLESFEDERQEMLDRRTRDAREKASLEEEARSSGEKLRATNSQLLLLRDENESLERRLADLKQELEGKANLVTQIDQERVARQELERQIEQMRAELRTKADLEERLDEATKAKEALASELEQTEQVLSDRIADVKALSESLEKVLEDKGDDDQSGRVEAMQRALETFQTETRNRVQKVIRHRNEAASLLEETLAENQLLSDRNEELLTELKRLEGSFHDGRERSFAAVPDRPSYTSDSYQPSRSHVDEVPYRLSRSFVSEDLYRGSRSRPYTSDQSIHTRSEEMAAYLAETHRLEHAKEAQMEALHETIRALERKIERLRR